MGGGKEINSTPYFGGNDLIDEILKRLMVARQGKETVYVKDIPQVHTIKGGYSIGVSYDEYQNLLKTFKFRTDNENLIEIDNFVIRIVC